MRKTLSLKNISFLILLGVLTFVSSKQYAEAAVAGQSAVQVSNAVKYTNSGQKDYNYTQCSAASVDAPFYGIWVYASKTSSDCTDIVRNLRANGFNGKMYETTDWSNLNKEHWYVVSAGTFATEYDANAALPRVCALGYSDAYVKYTGYRYSVDPVPQQPVQQPVPQVSTAFYGIWVVGSKDSSDCTRVINDLNSKGLPAKMYETTDWTNLNSEHWYVVSAGEYDSESAAYAMLPSVQNAGYSDAYVKYTGERR